RVSHPSLLLSPVLLYFFFFSCSRDHPDLHSFPTRRSSDLHGPISGSPVEGSGVLFVLQGVLTPEQEGDPEEGYFHAIPLDVFSEDRKSTRLNSSHVKISYAVFCLKKKNIISKPLICEQTRA